MGDCSSSSRRGGPFPRTFRGGRLWIFPVHRRGPGEGPRLRSRTFLRSGRSLGLPSRIGGDPPPGRMGIALLFLLWVSSSLLWIFRCDLSPCGALATVRPCDLLGAHGPRAGLRGEFLPLVVDGLRGLEGGRIAPPGREQNGTSGKGCGKVAGRQSRISGSSFGNALYARSGRGSPSP